MTFHIYDADIEEKKGERSMDSVKIIDIKEQSLCSLEDYLSAIKMITNINGLSQYIKVNAIPVIADFQNFIPMLGPLHVSLNSREDVMKIHYDFFKKQFFFFILYLYLKEKICSKT